MYKIECVKLNLQSFHNKNPNHCKNPNYYWLRITLLQPLSTKLKVIFIYVNPGIEEGATPDILYNKDYNIRGYI